MQNRLTAVKMTAILNKKKFIGGVIMTVAKIRLNTINDVKEFVNAVTLCDYEVDLVSGRYAIDAKSIMGIFSLDLTQPVELRVHTDECGGFMQSIDKFIEKD